MCDVVQQKPETRNPNPETRNPSNYPTGYVYKVELRDPHAGKP
jgi:hypothetical protein